MTRTLTLTLPWPKRWAWPNSRCHWSQKASARKRMKARAKLETLAIDRPEWKPEAVTLDLEFKPPGRCDDDGCVASFKAYRDGIAEALGVDDRIFKLGKVSIVRPGSKPGWVKATLTLLARQ